MIPPHVVAGVAQGIGSLIGSNRREGAARESRRGTDSRMMEAIAAFEAERRALLAAGGGGIDFAKLRNDALAAGFNPLTALAATGAGGYNRAELFSPFGSVADLHVRRAELHAASSGAVVDNAGGIGDAIRDGFGAAFEQRNQDTAFGLERDRLALEAAVALSQPRAYGTGGGSVANGSPFHGGPVGVSYSSASPGAYYGQSFIDRVFPGMFPATPANKGRTQGLFPMIYDALGMTSAWANPVTGDLMTPDQKAGSDWWGKALAGIGNYVIEWPVHASRKTAAVKDFFTWDEMPVTAGRSGAPPASSAAARLSSAWQGVIPKKHSFQLGSSGHKWEWSW